MTEPRDRGNWAEPVSTLDTPELPSEAINLNVQGRSLVGPLQGLGQLWQKTYRVRLDGDAIAPQRVIEEWKENFQSFWPRGNRFYGALKGISPGDVAVLNLSAGGMALSTGIMVLYSDDESFTFMTPEGHMFSGWVTFSAHVEDDTTVAQAQVLVRANDPLWEVLMRLFGFKKEDRFWLDTLESLAGHFDVQAHAEMSATRVDPKLQWSKAGNIWHNALMRSALYTAAAPARWALSPLRRNK